jgi:outer membrane protein OmpA-like peptidoglycan-associated protein
LIEGEVTGDARICGGVVLKDVKASPLPDLDPSCNTILPAEDRYQVPFAPRGPGPNPRLPGQRRTPPPGSSAVAGPPPSRTPPPPPTPPFTPKTFTAYYDFDTEWAALSVRSITEAMTYAKAVNAKQVEVVGYRGVAKLSDGRNLVERPDMAKRRAERMAATLRDIGVPASAIKVSWKEKPLPGNGVDDRTRRKTTILVTP